MNKNKNLARNNSDRRSNNDRKFRGKQGRKDSSSKRINDDNERVSKLDKDIEKTFASNDPSWYAANPGLLEAAASIPFSTTTGQQLRWSGTNSTVLYGNSVPGVFMLGYETVLGGSDLDAINAAKDSIYSFVVHANSRNTRYNSTDLIQVIVAGMNVFAAIGAAIRAYGTMRIYDQRNKYLPQALVSAMGFDFDDLQNNLSNMWFDINEVIARSTQIWIPNTMPVMDRWFWLNSNVYMDSSNLKGQYYVLRQQSFWGYNETFSTSGGALAHMNTDGTVDEADGVGADNFQMDGTVTWKGFMTVLNGMISALLNSEDRGIMMGDILKAYGPEKIYAVTPINVDYKILPVYDQEVLSQIENADVLNPNYIPFAYTQSQQTLRLTADWGANNSSSTPNIRKEDILNFHNIQNPSPAQIMVATRLKALGGTPEPMPSDSTKISTVIPTTCGTEVVVIAGVYDYDSSNQLRFSAINQNGASQQSLFYELAFDWSPWQYNVTAESYSYAPKSAISDYSEAKVVTAYGDYDQYTTLDATTLMKMNNTALYSEFGVPVI